MSVYLGGLAEPIAIVVILTLTFLRFPVILLASIISSNEYCGCTAARKHHLLASSVCTEATAKKSFDDIQIHIRLRAPRAGNDDDDVVAIANTVGLTQAVAVAIAYTHTLRQLPNPTTRKYGVSTPQLLLPTHK